MSEMNDLSNNRESQIPILPLDVPGGRDSASGPAAEEFIQARWLMTAAVLREALSEQEAEESAGAEIRGIDETAYEMWT